ncbi:MAG: hypothetical protein ACKVPX_11795 [Myxococcaceae bacterium]
MHTINRRSSELAAQWFRCSYEPYPPGDIELCRRRFVGADGGWEFCPEPVLFVAYVTAHATVREILRHLGLPSQVLPQARAQDSPQLELYA